MKHLDGQEAQEWKDKELHEDPGGDGLCIAYLRHQRIDVDSGRHAKGQHEEQGMPDHRDDVRWDFHCFVYLCGRDEFRPRIRGRVCVCVTWRSER